MSGRFFSKPLRIHFLSLFLFLVVCLSACSGGEESDITTWMKAQRALTKPRISPLQEPKKYMPQAYTEETAIDPFSSQRLTQALKQDTPPSSGDTALLAAEQNRRKEPLEAFPLDTMAMVGSVNKKGLPIALVMVDKLLYQVRKGSYLGPNFGLVTKVDETQISIREIVQDAAGEWIERAAMLQLQER
jgi:type IV pilus assembly protein PilP